MFCYRCGKQVALGSGFCNGCGAIIQQTSGEMWPPANGTSGVHKRRIALVVITVSLLVVLLVIGTLYGVFGPSTLKYRADATSRNEPSAGGSADSQHSQQAAKLRRDCIEQATATGSSSLAIAKHACDCGVTEFDRTVSQEQAIKAAQACAAADVAAIDQSTDPAVQGLVKERRHMVNVVTSAQAMLNSPGLATRARIFCHSKAQATPMGSYTLDELESAEAQLMKTEPPTREEEINRQYQLSALRYVLDAAYQNLNACIGAHSLYGQPLPTDEEEREKIAQAQTRIVEIDQEIMSRK